MILIVIPLFMILRPLHLTNTIPGVVIVYMVWSLPFALWMLQGYVAAVPRELEEAASVDGASRVRTIVSIVMPLLRPGLVATAMFTFISAWNEFFFALVLLQDPQLKTLPLVLARFVGAEGQVQFGPLAAGVRPRHRPQPGVLRLPAAPADVRPAERRSQGLSPFP